MRSRPLIGKVPLSDHRWSNFIPVLPEKRDHRPDTESRAPADADGFYRDSADL